MKDKKGKVYIVGAGPGDPELISVKGLKALEKADSVLYDHLSPPELLDHVKSSCRKICVGKKDGFHLMAQDEINEILYEEALSNEVVLRLKGGDPFMFSRGSEEARYLHSRGVEIEIIPGITSALAAPESSGIPLTVKGDVQSVAVITGRKKNIDAEIDVPDCGTLVYLMGVSNISNIVKALKKNGWDENTPCAFIEKATRKDSRTVRATIGTIEEVSKKEEVKPPAVLVVGKTVDNPVF